MVIDAKTKAPLHRLSPEGVVAYEYMLNTMSLLEVLKTGWHCATEMFKKRPDCQLQESNPDDPGSAQESPQL